MTDQDVRDAVADYLDGTHGNREFIRQVREGEQDDGPFIQGALGLLARINENWALMPAPEVVLDE